MSIYLTIYKGGGHFSFLHTWIPDDFKPTQLHQFSIYPSALSLSLLTYFTLASIHPCQQITDAFKIHKSK